jgi:uncharacterized membrane protein
LSADFFKYLTVALASCIKFIGGPLVGLPLGLGWLETALFSAIGMMLTVLAITYFGDWFRRIWQARFPGKRKLFSATTRRNVRLWRKYGIYGIAFLTPLLLTPIGGTILAVSFGEKKHRIIFWMTLSALLWGLILTLVIFESRNVISQWG